MLRLLGSAASLAWPGQTCCRAAVLPCCRAAIASRPGPGSAVGAGMRATGASESAPRFPLRQPPTGLARLIPVRSEGTCSAACRVSRPPRRRGPARRRPFFADRRDRGPDRTRAGSGLWRRCGLDSRWETGCQGEASVVQVLAAAPPARARARARAGV